MKQLVIGESFGSHCRLEERKLMSRDLGAIKLARICNVGTDAAEVNFTTPLRSDSFPFARKRDKRMLYQ
jgi:hypothetical protein